jgi:hypothetical protein
MDNKKVRAVRMDDALYAQCQRTAGARAFSPWAEHVLAQAAGEVEIPPGSIPGGLCAGSTLAGPCGRNDAWIYMKNRRVFLCPECCALLVKSSPATKEFCEDRRPVTTKGDHHRQLVQAVVNAANALAEFERKQVPTKTSNIPPDIAAVLAAARTED